MPPRTLTLPGALMEAKVSCVCLSCTGLQGHAFTHTQGFRPVLNLYTQAVSISWTVCRVVKRFVPGSMCRVSGASCPEWITNGIVRQFPYLYPYLCGQRPARALSLSRVGKEIRQKKRCFEDKVKCADCRGGRKEDEDREVQAPSPRQTAGDCEAQAAGKSGQVVDVGKSTFGSMFLLEGHSTCPQELLSSRPSFLVCTCCAFSLKLHMADGTLVQSPQMPRALSYEGRRNGDPTEGNTAMWENAHRVTL